MTSPGPPRGIRTWAALVALGVLASGCGGDPAEGASGTRTGTTSTHVSASPSPAPTATVPPAVQGLEPCPSKADRRFVLRGDGERVRGFRRGSGDRVVILTHQSRGTACDLAALGAALADAGYRAVAWTGRHGASLDGLRLLVAEERRRGAEYVALVGASLGAATSIAVTRAVDPPVDAVVALSPSSQSERNGDVARAAARYAGPLMAVAGEYDPSFVELPPELARVHDGPELVEIVAGSSDHGKDFVRRRADPMVDRVIGFLGS